jgi:PAS domain S-box-containing protein/putative nucleotidyltransferase with HDIG domain
MEADRSLYRKGQWVEDVGEPVAPGPLRIDYRDVQRRFTRSIFLAYAIGFVAYMLVNIVLWSLDMAGWGRILFNMSLYTVIFAALAFVVYRLAIRSWLRGHLSGRVLTIAEISSDAVFSLDRDGLISSWSRGAQRILGYVEGEVVGKEAATVLPDGIPPGEHGRGGGSPGEGVVTRRQTRGRRKDGEVFPAEISLTFLSRPDSSPDGMLIVLRDTTKQAQIEDELRRVHQEIESLSATGGSSAGGRDPLEEFERIRTAAAATVRAVAAVAERRDPYTANHQKRVSELAQAIAKEMGLTDEQVEGVRVAGILHDTGKVVVPSDILSKPGRLSEFEFGIIKSHPKADFEIVEGIEFPWPVAEAVLQHHERMDGSGYPSGLKGEDIVLEARILAVADVVEAMASHRPYRPARGIEKAMDEIDSNKGRLYDPAVVEACTRLFREKHYELA